MSNYERASEDSDEVIRSNDRHLFHYKCIDPNSDPEDPTYRVFAVAPQNESLFEHNTGYKLVHRPPEEISERPIPGPRTAERLITIFAKNKSHG